MAYAAATYDIAVERFWSRVDIGEPDACWPWTLSKGSKGYGQVWWCGRLRGTHVVAFLIVSGEDPGDLHVLHTCDRPICCNPRHLFLGTHDDNMADMVRKGRQNNVRKASRGCRNGRAVLTDASVAELRSRASNGESHSALARSFGVSRTQVRRIVRTEAWA